MLAQRTPYHLSSLSSPNSIIFKGSLGDQFKTLVIFQHVLILTLPEGELSTKSGH